MERRLNAAVRELARERRLPLMDAASELSGPANFAEFVHFTDQGVASMAKMVAGAIE